MKRYEEVKIELLVLAAQDVVTASGFDGKDQDFEDFLPASIAGDPTAFVN